MNYCEFFSTVGSVDCSPGPQYHIDAKMTRFGRVGTPSYSMLGRARRAGETSYSLNHDKLFN